MHDPGTQVSILVLLDDSLEDEDRVLVRVVVVRFQSLFSWMIRSKRFDLDLLGGGVSFNPCSLG